MGLAPLPDWVVPPSGGFTAEDFLRLRGLPRHTELIDGSLVFVSPQEKWHSRVINLLVRELDGQAPLDARADREMAVQLGRRQVAEPDVVVVTTAAYERAQPSTHYGADDVVLAVEAVSPDSEDPDSDDRDRDTKPRKYAQSGIAHFWRIDYDHGRSVAYVYERDPATATYALTGIHSDRLRVSAPFELDIDLTSVGKRPN